MDAQTLFTTRELVKKLLSLANFNELINEGEADESVDNLMEVSFYALLALINIAQENSACQVLVQKLSGIDMVIK